MSKARSTVAVRLRESAPVFAALGDPTRLQVVARLCSYGPQSITRLSADMDVTRQAVTKHLGVLAEAGLVHDVRRGRERIWELDPKRLDEAHRYLDLISSRWDEALDRLRNLVEE